MSSKLFIGGLSWGTNDESLRACFEQFGQVEDAVVIRDRDTGRSRGFGFVTYGSLDEAQQAINNMNDTELDGRQIKVDLAADRGSSAPRNNNYRPRGGYNGGNNGGDQRAPGRSEGNWNRA